jgi:hypothetical protein
MRRARLLALSVMVPLVVVAPRQPGTISLASTSDAGVKGDKLSSSPHLSAAGTKVAFDSRATNLDPADSDAVYDIYVKDLVTGDIVLASTSDDGKKANAASNGPSLSGDGDTVAFFSYATNLDPADTDFVIDIYVKNLVTGDISLASTSDEGDKGNGTSRDPELSHDGTMVTFWSSATNLDPADTDVDDDVYVKSLATGDLTLASTSSDGVKGNGFSAGPALSAQGRVVAFSSSSTNLHPNDGDSGSDVYVKDLSTGHVMLASASTEGVTGDDDSFLPSLASGGALKVAFWSYARNLVPADSDSHADIYVKDLGSGEIVLASTSSEGVKGDADSYSPVLSASGQAVAFYSFARNLHPADADVASDIYVKDLSTGEIALASTSERGIKGDRNSYVATLSRDGTVAGFSSYARNLHPGDTDGIADIYVKRLDPP